MDFRKTNLLIPWFPQIEYMFWLRRDWLQASHSNRDPKTAMLFLIIHSVTDFTHLHRDNRDKITCMFIALSSGSLKIKQASTYKIVKTQKHSISASYLKFTVLTWIYASASCFDAFTRNFDTDGFSNLRAQLKSNKIFYIIINSFTLFNCRPAIKNKDYITR